MGKPIPIFTTLKVSFDIITGSCIKCSVLLIKLIILFTLFNYSMCWILASVRIKQSDARYISAHGVVKKREQYYDLDQKNRALDAAACGDVKKYLKSCKNQNRLSQL